MQKNNTMFRKVVASSVLAFSILTISVKSFAIPELYPAETIYQFSETSNLGSGILHENIIASTIYGKYNINVVRIDIKNEYPQLKGIFNPEGLNYRDSVTNMVNKNGAVAGVNGDYFDYTPVPTSLGTLINNGEMISSPIMRQYALPTFYLDNNNQAKIEYFDRKVHVNNLTKGTTIYMDNLNKVSKNFPTLSVLDKNFGHQSIGAKFHKDMVEVVVDNNKVVEVRKGWEAVPIPTNGFVIVGRGESAAILDSLAPGDEVELVKETTPGIENIKFAIGGGSTILRDGKYVNTNISDSGRHPRTGIAVNQDNTEIILVTVDGKAGVSAGMKQQEFATLLARLGGYNGLNLDGGGSTTMAVKKDKNAPASLVNKPSGGSQRQVVNGVGVFNNAPAGSLDRIQLSTNYDTMMVGASNGVAINGFDGQNNVFDQALKDFKLTVEGIDYDFDGYNLVAKSTGFAKLTATYDNNGKQLTASKTIPVYGSAVDLTSDTKELSVFDGNSYPLPVFKAKDISGREAIISPNNISFDLSDNVGTFENGSFISNGNSGYITAKFGDGVAKIKVISTSGTPTDSSNVKATEFRDTLNSPAIDAGQKFLVLSETKDLTPERKALLNNKVNSSFLTVSLNGFSEEFNGATNQVKKINSNAGYTLNNYNNVSVLNLDSKKGSVSTTNSYQWIKFKNDLNNIASKNIIITSQASPAGYKDKLEEKNLYQILADYKVTHPDKNVFFVHGGGSGGIRLKDGIRYIGLNSNDTKAEEVLVNDSLVEFVLDGENLRYNYKAIYK